MVNLIKKQIKILIGKILLHKQKILISIFLFIAFSAIAYAYAIQEYFSVHIPNLISANDRKELEIIRLKEKLELIEAYNSKISAETNPNFHNKILLGMGFGLLCLVGAGLLCFLGGGKPH